MRHFCCTKVRYDQITDRYLTYHCTPSLIDHSLIPLPLFLDEIIIRIDFRWLVLIWTQLKFFDFDPSDPTVGLESNTLAGDLLWDCSCPSVSPAASVIYNYIYLKRCVNRKSREREGAAEIEGNPNGKIWSSYVPLKMFHLRSRITQDCPALECIMNHINTSLFDNQSLFLSLMELVSQSSLWSHSPAAYQLH